jgi:hypothetical protein
MPEPPWIHLVLQYHDRYGFAILLMTMKSMTCQQTLIRHWLAEEIKKEPDGFCEDALI